MLKFCMGGLHPSPVVLQVVEGAIAVKGGVCAVSDLHNIRAAMVALGMPLGTSHTYATGNREGQ